MLTVLNKPAGILKSKTASAWSKTALVVLMLSPLAYADTVTTTFNVSANVVDDCQVSATNIDFGDYRAVTAADLDANSAVAVRCTLATAYEIGLDQGLGGVSVNDRKMLQGANELSYQLFRDPARTQNWGNTPTTDTVAGTGTGNSQNFQVYARIPSNQNVATGAYTDTITVTVTF
ncbi:spore coat U domain-containing protein [Rheinheimera hassiensis]|uniref:Csu type fimbrial protein n=1 Tax=Rheinheimera hassiensis TaxID=1193627 RepID=UPI001F05F638|nr:spore coat U domain-containing protein [Rheinheimera hassiensis]